MTKNRELDLVLLIDKIFSQSSREVMLGMGDDCAAIKPKAGHELLLTTDTLIEKIHFDRGWISPFSLGKKSVSVNLSDIAAMGGRPRFLMMSINITDDVDRRWVKRYLQGLYSVAIEHGCALIGGNIARTESDLSFTVTAIGDIRPGLRVDRSGAKPGDLIYVTGTPGDSALGLDLLMKRKKRYTPAERKLIKRHIEPTPRTEWGQLLSKKRLASAMIDISDGVVLDLRRVLESSNVSARLDLTKFPLSKSARGLLKKKGKSAWSRILGGGEDYELMFTVPARKQSVIEKLIENGNISAGYIGKVAKHGLPLEIIDPDGEPVLVENEGFLHNSQ